MAASDRKLVSNNDRDLTEQEALYQQLFGLTNGHLSEATPIAASTSTSTLKSGQHNTLLHKQVIKDWQNLQHKAASEGFDLQVASGFRSFDRQCLIWNNKFIGKTPVYDLNGNIIDFDKFTDVEKVFSILNFSALPGLSRHHWGTDFDYFDPSLLKGKSLQLQENEYASDGVFGELNKWLDNNLQDFGFFKPYRSYNETVQGIAIEPWHLSHKATSQLYFNAIEQLDPQVLINVLKQNSVLGVEQIEQHIHTIIRRFALTICD